MPRKNRNKSITKVYHVMMRGINKQDIFLDKQDFNKIIKEIKRTKERYGYQIYAYAFMNDHIHLIIFDKNENISIAIQSLNISYSIYFNKKYERTGHLFENRFKSKIVEDESYLRSLVRYIHKNPENASIEPYKWTSYKEYIGRHNIINNQVVLKLFGNTKKQALTNIIKFHENYNKINDYTKGYEFINKVTDEEAIEIIKNITNEQNLIKIQNYNRTERDKTILKILEIEGIKKIQISRIIGISVKTINRIENVHKRDRCPEKKRPQMGLKRDKRRNKWLKLKQFLYVMVVDMSLQNG